MDRLTEILTALDSDPVFAMSLGSKELFHSNLLAWFIERSQIVRDALAELWGLPSGAGSGAAVSVERERHHFDIVAKVPGRRPVLIENKVFALPDLAQLERYAVGAATAFGDLPELVLLSLTDPGWPDGRWESSSGGVWHYRSYEELAGMLSQTAPAVAESDAFVGELLRRWADLLRRLLDLVGLLGEPDDDEPLILSPDVRAQLDVARLNPAIQRLRCQQVVARISRALTVQELDGVQLAAGVTNSSGFAEGFDVAEYPQFGWQLQGNQFRLAMRVSKRDAEYGASVEARAARIQTAQGHGGFFDFSSVWGHVPSASCDISGWLRYDPDFVYRYVRVPEIRIGEAATAGLECIRWARQFRRQRAT